MAQLTLEQSIFHSFPWFVLTLFILSCNLNNSKKPIVSRAWLISMKCIGLLFLATYASLHTAGYFPEWNFYNGFHALKSGYLLVPILLGYIGNSLKDKKLSRSPRAKDV